MERMTVSIVDVSPHFGSSCGAFVSLLLLSLTSIVTCLDQIQIIKIQIQITSSWNKHVYRHLEKTVFHFPSKNSCLCFCLLNDRMRQMVPLARILSKTQTKSANSARAPICTTHTTAPEPADCAKPRVWIKTAILCSTPSGCLAAGRKRKTFSRVWHTDKGGSEKSWFSRSRGHGGGGHGEGRWLGLCCSRA